MYRTPDGFACAVGCLIPDDLYDRLRMETERESTGSEEFDYDDDGNVISKIENVVVFGLVGIDPQLDAVINGDSPEGRRKLNFLRAAQSLHDNHSEDAKEFIMLLDVAAIAANLELVPA